MSAGALRVTMIGLLVVAAVLSAFSGGEGGIFLALSFACFVVAVAVFARWRRKLRASVFDREEKTSE